MTATAMGFIRLFSGAGRLPGPLFDKELRVASRRTRSYALRSGYLVLLSVLMLSAWLSFVGVTATGSVAFSVSRGSAMSLYVAARVIWFQFVAAQLVAAVVVGFSVTDEMRRGTMSVLLTTPITSPQIVVGKLLGGLLQVALLLAVSLPVLAILRVHGGLSWGFVFAGFCVTSSAATCAGALSLLLTTRYRHPYQVLSVGAVVYFVVFLVLPVVALLLTFTGAPVVFMAQSVLRLTNPFYALFKTATPVPGTGPAAAVTFPWPLHCLMVCAAAVLMLCVSMWRIRRAVAGTLSASTEVIRIAARPRRSPVMWRDHPGPVWYAKRGDRIIVMAALAVAGLIVVANGLRGRTLAEYLYYTERAFWLLAMLRLAISASAGITLEKESGAWPLLLTTPLEDVQILRAKALVALRRSAVLLLSAFAIQAAWLISGLGPFHLGTVLLSMLSRVVAVFFVLAAGLCFGVHLRTTTGAAATTIGTYLCLTYLVGTLLGGPLGRLLATLGREPRDPLFFSLMTTGGMVMLYVTLAAFLFERAQRQVRRYVF